MFRRLFVASFFFFLICGLARAQETDPVSLSKSFTAIPGTPRLARNESADSWLAVWRQGKPGKIFGRIVSSGGSVGKQTLLAKGIDTAPNGFDVAFNPATSKYLLVFETWNGLEAQVLDSKLAKQGAAISIEKGLENGFARILFDPDANQFFVFWLAPQDGNPGQILKVLTLDTAGNAVGNSVSLVKADLGKTFAALSVSRNPKTRNLNVLLLVTDENGAGSVLAFTVKSDRTLIQTKGVPVENASAGLKTIPQSSFNGLGSGFVVWSNGNALKLRKISSKGKTVGAAKLFTSASEIGTQPAIAYDQQNNQFVVIWSEGKNVRGVRINSSTGAIVGQIFDLAPSTLTHPDHPVLSCGSQTDSLLAVWEDAASSSAGSPDSKFRVRAGVVGQKGNGSETVVQVLDGAFVPLTVTVRAGTTIKWENQGSMVHTVTSGVPGTSAGALFDQSLGRAKTFKFTFTKAGSFDYFCRIHVQFGMAGKVIVTP